MWIKTVMKMCNHYWSECINVIHIKRLFFGIFITNSWKHIKSFPKHLPQTDSRTANSYVRNVVVAFWGVHVSPAKHSYSWLPRKCDYRQTDTRTNGQTDNTQSDPYVRYASQATQKSTNEHHDQSTTNCRLYLYLPTRADCNSMTW